MAYEDWKDRTGDFEIIDVRGAAGSILGKIRERASALKAGEGIEVVQSFEPTSLYGVLERMGFEHHTEKVSEDEYRVFFYRTEVRGPGDVRGRPIGLSNYPIIDEDLGRIATEFWGLTWQDGNRYLDYNTRLLLSMSNAIGAGRDRQALRELMKAYANGIDSRAFDDVFEQVAWNMGIGYFSSEILLSPAFQAYKTIKRMEKDGKGREEINAALKERFGYGTKEKGC